MTPFYNSDDRRRALMADAMSWIGTPFAENCAVKGVTGGVSCDRYQVALHTASGALPELELPVLPVEQVRHWHEHHSVSKLLQFLHCEALRDILVKLEPGEPPMIGDIAVFRVGETEHHIGVWCGSLVCHVAIPAGVVVRSTRDEEFMKMVRCFYRIMDAKTS